ncbi:MAG: hypothetical protein BWY83_02191 [bacterium ADurb.Bin478]|nr:MAG: hypothetical protein BWY83_02191 [bacterium ADurb.Bin478]
MDHQIQHHRHIRAAGIEGRQPMGFDEPGRDGAAVQGADRRIEPFDVAHLQQGFAFSRRSHQLFGLRHGGGNGFFDEHRLAHGQRLQGHRRMQCGGHNDAHRLHLLQQSVHRGKGGAAVLFRNRTAALRIAVEHTDQIGLRILRQRGGMHSAKFADANQSDFYFVRLFHTSPFDPCDEWRK